MGRRLILLNKYTHTALIFQVHITMEDENDNPPKFSQSHYELHVKENWRPEGPLLRLSVSDPDLDPQVRLTLVGKASDLFTLSQSGTIRLNRPLDREEVPVYVFSIVARDTGKFSHYIKFVIQHTHTKCKIVYFYSKCINSNCVLSFRKFEL